MYFLCQNKKIKRHILNIKIKDKIYKIENNNINIYNILSSLALLKVLNLNITKIINLYKRYEPTQKVEEKFIILKDIIKNLN